MQAKRGAQGSSSKNGFAQSEDWHATLGSLLLKAAKASDPTERMLAVCRTVLCLTSNLLRPATGFVSTPVVVLGQHYLSSRELSEKFRGDATQVFLQELCAYDPTDKPTMHKKLADPTHMDIVRMHFTAAPVSRAKVKKEGLIGTTSTAYIEVGFDHTESIIQFIRHGEQYTFSLPHLMLTEPLDTTCPIDFDGKMTVTCTATGLQAVIKFKPWQEHQVKGYIANIANTPHDASSTTPQRIAKIEGNWDGQITAEALELNAIGTLYDASDYQPPLPYPLAINLAQPGPRLMTRLWSSILESVLYTDVQQATALGKKVGELVNTLPVFMKKSLLYEVQEGPPKTKNQEGGGDDVGRDKRPLPPAAKQERAKGRGLKYQLQYNVKAIPVPVTPGDDFSFATTVK